MSDAQSSLFGPDASPVAVADEYDAWARLVIVRSSLAASDWWADARRSGGVEGGVAERLRIEIARALRQAASGARV